MTVRELNPEQYKEVCQDYICRVCNDGESPSWYDLSCADMLVSEEAIFAYYDGINFTPDDFGCSQED